MKKSIYILTIALLIGLGGFAQNRTGSKQLIRFYPNPATSFIYFDLPENQRTSYSLSIFNFMGKKVYELKNMSQHSTVSLEDFFRGIYIYQLRDNSGRVIESGKFQVIR